MTLGLLNVACKCFSATHQEKRQLLAFPVCCTPPIKTGLSPLHCVLRQLKVFQRCGEDELLLQGAGTAGEEARVKLLLPQEVRVGEWQWFGDLGQE